MTSSQYINILDLFSTFKQQPTNNMTANRKALATALRRCHYHRPCPNSRRILASSSSNVFTTGVSVSSSSFQPSFVVTRVFSSSFSSESQTPPPSSSSSSRRSLRRLIRPFLIACHPDANAAMGDDGVVPAVVVGNEGKTKKRAKETNLQAVQIINGLVDVIESLIFRCIGDGTGGIDGPLPELKARYDVEFILSPNNSVGVAESTKRGKRRGDDDGVSSTLRSIAISFPEGLRKDVRHHALLLARPRGASENERSSRMIAASRLREHTESEFVRLLTVAGMEIPVDYVDHRDDNDRRSRSVRPHQQGDVRRWTLSDHFLHELGIDSPVENEPSEVDNRKSAFFGRSSTFDDQSASPAPPTYAHPQLIQKRRAFMNSIPWDKFAQDYDRAFHDAQADWTTTRLGLYNISTVQGRERREEFVSRICASVRIWREVNEEDIDDNDVDDIPEGLDLIAQLIAMRRLSILLYDNFDRLKMEKMGRMWERLVIVLTPPRGITSSIVRLRDDGTPIVHLGRKLTKFERRKRRRDRLEPNSRGRMRHDAESYRAKSMMDEEGAVGNDKPRMGSESSRFKFSYGTKSDQGAGNVTAYIPIDFRDGELVRQLHTHVRDYFDNCCGNVGLLKFGADGVIRADIGDEAADQDAEKENSRMGMERGS